MRSFCRFISLWIGYSAANFLGSPNLINIFFFSLWAPVTFQIQQRLVFPPGCGGWRLCCMRLVCMEIGTYRHMQMPFLYQFPVSCLPAPEIDTLLMCHLVSQWLCLTTLRCLLSASLLAVPKFADSSLICFCSGLCWNKYVRFQDRDAGKLAVLVPEKWLLWQELCAGHTAYHTSCQSPGWSGRQNVKEFNFQMAFLLGTRLALPWIYLHNFRLQIDEGRGRSRRGGW